MRSVYENQIVVKWPSAIASPVLSILYGVEYDRPRKSAAFVVFRDLVDHGSEAAAGALGRLRVQPDRFYFDSAEFEFFSRLLRDRNKPALAGQLEELATRAKRAPGSTLETGQVRDIDGNIYRTVKIGDQWWMAENLRVTRDPRGNPVQSYFYDDDQARYGRFGRLYTWDAAMNASGAEKARGISPDGWHIPSEEDWDELVEYLGGAERVGVKIKVGGETGFEAVLAGGADGQGRYVYFQEYAMFWSSTSTDPRRAYHMGIGVDDRWDKFAALKACRIHVRCVKDE